jgi:hypothetical protein
VGLTTLPVIPTLSGVILRAATPPMGLQLTVMAVLLAAARGVYRARAVAQSPVAILVEQGVQLSGWAEPNVHSVLAQSLGGAVTDGGANHGFGALLLQPATRGISAC